MLFLMLQVRIHQALFFQQAVKKIITPLLIEFLPLVRGLAVSLGCRF